MRAEEVLGVGVIAFLLWWIYSHKNTGGLPAPGTINVNVPPPRGSGLIMPAAPNLNFITNQGSPTNTILNVIQPTAPQSTPSPCSCTCDDGASSMVTQTINDFTKSITAALGKKYDEYLDNITQVLTPDTILKSFAGSSVAKANSDLVLSSQAQAQKNGTGVSLTVGSVSYSAAQENKDFLNSTGIYGVRAPALERAGNITLASLSMYTPGRVVQLVGG